MQRDVNVAVLGHRKFFRMLPLWVFVSAGPLAGQVPQPSSESLTYHKSLFGGAKVSFRGGDRVTVYRFTGLSFSDNFASLMERHPAALAEAKKSFAYNGAAFVGAVGTTLLMVRFLFQAINDASDVSSGRITMETGTVSTGEIVALLGFGTLWIGGGALGKGRLKAGLRMFNELETSSGSNSDAGKLNAREPSMTVVGVPEMQNANRRWSPGIRVFARINF